MKKLKTPVAVFGLMACLLDLSSCSAGKTNIKALTYHDQPRVGDIVISDPAAIYPAQPNSTTTGATTTVELNFSITNQNAAKPDTLVGITAEDGYGSVSLSQSELNIKPGYSLYAPASRVNQDQKHSDRLENGVDAILTDKSSAIRPGLTVALKFTFKENGSVTVHVPVRVQPDNDRKYHQRVFSADQ